MKKTIIAVLAAITIAGCAGSPFTWDAARSVQVGMTEGEVVALLGKPYMVRSSGDTQTWVWSHANGLTGANGAVSFPMKSGKVSGVPTIPKSFE